MSTGRRRLAAALRLVSALALVVAAVVFFRQPLGEQVLPAAEERGLLDGSAVETLRSASVLGPAPGFLLRATSVPAGGTLWVDGRELGTLPFMGNVVCRDGQSVDLEVRREGFETWTRTVGCREQGQLEMTARLQPSG